MQLVAIEYQCHGSLGSIKTIRTPPNLITKKMTEKGIFHISSALCSEKVLSNIAARKELFIEFCGDEALGENTGRKLFSDLENVEHPFISLHLEVLYLNDPRRRSY
ncbi:hypothetical protein ACOBV8_22190 (plasmid) [Pseudoalteromonas espejiana]